MWGLAGSMLACIHMNTLTDQPQWKAAFEVQAARLFRELRETEKGPLWDQDLYGTIEPWLGPVHGFAGNMVPLIHGWEWLDGAQRARLMEAIPRTLRQNAWSAGGGANWLGRVRSEGPPKLCQHCHGAPGMVTTFADLPLKAPDVDALLAQGAELIWTAGPLAKGSNLCHGTGGNGYPFLKLYRRTGDAKWLERARAFAMAGIRQYEEAYTFYGRGRYSLWTGDIGLAIYLWDCATGEAFFPTIDVI